MAAIAPHNRGPARGGPIMLDNANRDAVGALVDLPALTDVL
jgi:hypothetical protein